MNTIFLLFSCSSYVKKLHQQIDYETNQNYSNYAGRNLKGRKIRSSLLNRFKRPKPSTSTRNRNRLTPPTKRRYVKSLQEKRRIRADDLIDTDQSASLWMGDDKNGFFFSNDSKKRHGDIIVVYVLKKLKTDITSELKRRFSRPVLEKASKKVEPDKKEATAKAPTASKKESSSTGKVYDKIPSVIVDEVNSKHILISGRKTLLFNNRKRIVEIQAVLNKKFISTEDTVRSDDLLETNIRILR